MDSEQFVDLYKKMLLIRLVEERLLELFSQGRLFGTVHTCIGQEANAVGVVANLGPNDVIFSNHRCHGHYLAATGDVYGLVSEIMGRETGICGGRGGSQHLCRGNFYTNGVQGGIVPNAVGMALAEEKLNRDSVTVVFLGDGTLGQGVTYEAMNIASLWSTPILFVIEHNGYAQSTPSVLQIAGEVGQRPRAFGIETTELATNEVEVIYEAAREVIASVRRGQKPACLILNTYRLSPHSKGDDCRDEAEIDNWRDKDPIVLARRKLDDETAGEIESQCQRIVAEAVQQAENAPYPAAAELIGIN